MPGMDGFEVCEHLKKIENLKETPVLFLTAAKGDKDIRIKALEVGAEAFLDKPIDESELSVPSVRSLIAVFHVVADGHRLGSPGGVGPPGIVHNS